MIIRLFQAEKNIAVLEQPIYSPHLAPCDFFLFPNLKVIIVRTCFEGVKAIHNSGTEGIPEESFQQWIEA